MLISKDQAHQRQLFTRLNMTDLILRNIIVLAESEDFKSHQAKLFWISQFRTNMFLCRKVLIQKQGQNHTWQTKLQLDMAKKVILHVSQKFKQFQDQYMIATLLIQWLTKVWKKMWQLRTGFIINMTSGKRHAILAWNMISMAEKERVLVRIWNKNSMLLRPLKILAGIQCLKMIEVYWVQENNQICQVLQTMKLIKALLTLESMMVLAKWEEHHETFRFQNMELCIHILLRKAYIDICQKLKLNTFRTPGISKKLKKIS